MTIQPYHWAWKRKRPSYHGGAARNYLVEGQLDCSVKGPDSSPRTCDFCSFRDMQENVGRPSHKNNALFHYDLSGRLKEISGDQRFAILGSNKFDMKGEYNNVPSAQKIHYVNILWCVTRMGS